LLVPVDMARGAVVLIVGAVAESLELAHLLDHLVDGAQGLGRQPGRAGCYLTHPVVAQGGQQLKLGTDLRGDLIV